MQSKLLIIKLGGAVVTQKDSPIPKARISIIKSLSKEIRQLTDQGYQIVLAHGAGSFAHGTVKKYDLHHGMKTPEQKQAFKEVQESMLKLNKIILDALSKANAQAISLPPHEFITQNAGKLSQIDTENIEKSLEKGLVPVLFGDMVLDDAWGCSVLSGDTIVCYLGEKLKATQVIFLSDVDGIFDSDPRKNPQAKLIPEVNHSNQEEVLKSLSPTERADVTGEMSGKILEIRQYLSKTEVYITNRSTHLGSPAISDPLPLLTSKSGVALSKYACNQTPYENGAERMPASLLVVRLELASLIAKNDPGFSGLTTNRPTPAKTSTLSANIA